MTYDKKVDVRIVERILSALQTGRYDALSQAESEFRNLYERMKDAEASASKNSDCLSDVLRANPEILGDTIVATAEETIEFIDQELERFRVIKARRPLTEAEKQAGTNCLLPLLSSLKDLLKTFA